MATKDDCNQFSAKWIQTLIFRVTSRHVINSATMKPYNRLETNLQLFVKDKRGDNVGGDDSISEDGAELFCQLHRVHNVHLSTIQ